MKKLLILFLVTISLFSCGASKTISNDDLLSTDFIANYKVTDNELARLKTTVTKGVDLKQKELPKSETREVEFEIDERGVAIDRTIISSKGGEIQDGYKGPIKEGEEIFFLQRGLGSELVFETASGIYLHFLPDRSYRNYYRLNSITNTNATYNYKEIRNVFIRFELEKQLIRR